MPQSLARTLLESPLSGALLALSRCLIEKLRDLKIAEAAFLTPFRLDQDDDSWDFDWTGLPVASLCSSIAAMLQRDHTRPESPLSRAATQSHRQRPLPRHGGYSLCAITSLSSTAKPAQPVEPMVAVVTTFRRRLSFRIGEKALCGNSRTCQLCKFFFRKV